MPKLLKVILLFTTSAYADTLFPMKILSRMYKALSEETRLKIITLLIDRDELCVCDLMDVLQLPQSTVSRHLAYLRDSGLVVDTRKGVWMYYRIKTEDKLAVNLLENLKELLKDNQGAAEVRKQLMEHLAAKSNNACQKA